MRRTPRRWTRRGPRRRRRRRAGAAARRGTRARPRGTSRSPPALSPASVSGMEGGGGEGVVTRPYGGGADLLLERALLSLPTRALAAKREVLRLEVDEVAADVAGPLGGMQAPLRVARTRATRARARARTRTRTVSTRCALGRGGAQASLATLLRALRGALTKELALLGGVPRLRLRLLALALARAERHRRDRTGRPGRAAVRRV